MQERIQITDTPMDVLTKMSEGNPGALTTLMQIMEKHDEIDPQAALGWLGAVLTFDTYGIYGSDIYVLFNDKCDRDIRKLLLLQRATQLGFFPESRLKELAKDQMRKINLTDNEWKDIDYKVCNRLGDFKKPN